MRWFSSAEPDREHEASGLVGGRLDRIPELLANADIGTARGRDEFERQTAVGADGLTPDPMQADDKFCRRGIDVHDLTDEALTERREGWSRGQLPAEQPAPVSPVSTCRDI